MNNIIAFITVFAFTLGLIAPACGFAWNNNGNNNNYSVIEICTASGIENRLIPNDEAPTEHQTSEQCPFCFAQNNLEAHKSPSAFTLHFQFVHQKIQAEQFETAFLSKTRRPQSTRAPPVLL